MEYKYELYNNKLNTSFNQINRLSESILNDYIIPHRLLNVSYLIKSLKEKKYTWEIDGKKVKCLIYLDFF